MTKPKPRETADERIFLRATSAELASYQAAAERLGISLSAWIREACEVHLGAEAGSPRGDAARACDEIERQIERIRDAL